MEAWASIPHSDHGSNGCCFSFFRQKDWSHSKIKKKNIWNCKISPKKVMTSKYIFLTDPSIQHVLFSIWNWNGVIFYVLYIYHNFSFKMEKKCCSETVSTDFLLHIYIYHMFSKKSHPILGTQNPQQQKSSPVVERTVGACVWTTEDLAKNPSAWEHREATRNNCEVMVACFGRKMVIPEMGDGKMGWNKNI